MRSNHQHAWNDLFPQDGSDDLQPQGSAATAPPLLGHADLTGSTAATGTTSAPAAATGASPQTHAAIALAARSILAGTNQVIAFDRLFTVGGSAGDPAYLIVSGLDRNEYTTGYRTSAMGHLAGGSGAQAFSNFGGDGWSTGIVFAYQAATGQYTNPSFGNLHQLAFDTGSNLGDTATLSVFGTNDAGLARTYAGNPLILSYNPAYFTDYGSVAVVTGTSATAPASATPGSVAAAAASYVGAAWNDNGCWVLASDISAKAGATLPLTSTSIGLAGVSNGEWFVAYDGPVSASSDWVAGLVAGEVVTFQTASGGGHITTVASGQGSSARLVDNITYVDSHGTILDSAHDGSANDVIVQAPHAAMQEFAGVNPANVVVYELDAPVVTATVGSVQASVGASIVLAADFTARDPKPGQGVTQYQVYGTNPADTLTVGGAATHATTAATAATVLSLAGVRLNAGAAGTDTIEVRASNGSYYGDWTALTVSVAAPVTAAAALASPGAAPVSVTDTAANVAAAADRLQALAAAGRLSAVTITGGLVGLTASQLSSDAGLLRLLPSSALQVSGATVAQAGALQADAQVAQFTLTDSAANVTGHAELAADTRLASITVTGTAGADTLDLTGIATPETISLSGNFAASIGGLSATRLSFISAPDQVTLGTGHATIAGGIAGASGITVIANFSFGLDALQLDLGGLAAVRAFDTSVNGAHAVALTGGGNTQGVVLLNQPATLTAATVAAHIHTNGGMAVVS